MIHESRLWVARHFPSAAIILNSYSQPIAQGGGCYAISNPFKEESMSTNMVPFDAESAPNGVNTMENERSLSESGPDLETMTSAVNSRCATLIRLLGEAQAELVGIGRDLIEIRSYIQERKVPGGFDGWLSRDFKWSRSQAYRFIDIAKEFSDCPNLGHYDQSAMYLLAAPGTPQAAKDEAKERAATGDFVDHATAALIIDKHKADTDKNEQDEIEVASKGEDASQVEDDGNDGRGDGQDEHTTEADEADEQEEATLEDDSEPCKHNIRPKSSCSFCKAEADETHPNVITFSTGGSTSSKKPKVKAKATKPKPKLPEKHHHVFSPAGTAWVNQTEPDRIKIELCEPKSEAAFPSKTIWHFGMPLSMAKALHTHLGECIELMEKKEGVSSHELQ